METKKYYVYELINLYGTVEYVGETIRPERRFIEHTKYKYENSNVFGKFYKRQDIFMNIVETFEDRKDARELEKILKNKYGIECTEHTRAVKGGKLGGMKTKQNGHIQKLNKNTKRIILQYKTSGEFIKKWESLSLAAKTLKIQQSEITKCAQLNRKSAGGFVWKYEKN
jgi:predicted GIY-YIG superfamily endonuclease